MNRNTYDNSSIIHVNKKFLEVSHCSHAKQRQGNVQKSVVKFVFFSQTRTFFVAVLVAITIQHYMIIYFVILFYIILTRALLFALAKSIYYTGNKVVVQTPQKKLVIN